MIFYRGYVVEWIDYRKDFRIYKPEHPEQTVAYMDGPFSSIKEEIDFHIDTMHEGDSIEEDEKQ